MEQTRRISTPKPLRDSLAIVSPPIRRSSLAFQFQAQSPASTRLCDERILSSTSELKTSSLWAPNMSPRNSITPLRNILQRAKADLHRDMFAASSPASSIESRMHLGQDDLFCASRDADAIVDSNDGKDTTSWRYSTAPQYLATPYKDVREPLPSPTLPDPLPALDLGRGFNIEAEPASSGFTSPNIISDQSVNYNTAVNMALPLSLPDSPIDQQHYITDISNFEIPETKTSLERSMEGLRVEESPIVSHLRRKSSNGPNIPPNHCSPVRTIYLSQSAEAAAESAKAKRRLLKDAFEKEQDYISGVEIDIEAYNHDPRCRSDFDVHDFQKHRMKRHSLTPCPDPSAHNFGSSRTEQPMSAVSPNVLMMDRSIALAQMYHNSIMPRATATGSPMPFPRQRTRPPTAQSDPYAGSSTPLRHFHRVDMAHKYSNPEGHHTRRSAILSDRPNYAFSTAASKVYGSSQAPDFRIRDSYKTDTLTALARPPSRYRKNGIGADVLPRGVGRYYQRPPSSMRPSSARSRPSSRQTYHGEEEIRFRSSPPRAPGSESFVPMSRKRAMDDTFLVADGQAEVRQWRPAAVSQGSNELMQLDSETNAAVRMSIFGTSTPEALHQARQGLQELSPNVQVYRKGRQENVHMRKKRRPSYWDNDLKEIRESPAGRGGVNSPVSAQASMRAEFEIASLRNTEVDVDEQDQERKLEDCGVHDGPQSMLM